MKIMTYKKKIVDIIGTKTLEYEIHKNKSISTIIEYGHHPQDRDN